MSRPAGASRNFCRRTALSWSRSSEESSGLRKPGWGLETSLTLAGNVHLPKLICGCFPLLALKGINFTSVLFFQGPSANGRKPTGYMVVVGETFYICAYCGSVVEIPTQLLNFKLFVCSPSNVNQGSFSKKPSAGGEIPAVGCRIPVFTGVHPSQLVQSLLQVNVNIVIGNPLLFFPVRVPSNA